MKTIKIAFYKKTAPKANWIDKIIAWWTKGLYSHVELIVENEMYSTSPRDGHVRKKKHIYDKNTWDYLTLKITEKDYKKFLNFFEQTQGLKYDWFGIFGFISPISDREDKYFCSEWVTKALIIVGINKLFPIEPSKTSPNRLYKLLNKNESVFKGVK